MTLNGLHAYGAAARTFIRFSFGFQRLIQLRMTSNIGDVLHLHWLIGGLIVHTVSTGHVKDFCVARFLHIGTIEGNTLAKINLE